ncbi:hypothetical protein NL676_014600 [Syzygium grande]|nr:hypothetical protein NL676_014600 [Syzygium grande]
MWGVLSCFVGPLVCLLMIRSSRKAMPVVTFPTLHRPAGHPEYAHRASPGHLPEGRGCANVCCCGGAWTFQEDKRFENALAMLPGRVDLSSLRDFVEGIAPEFPGKSVEQVGRHLEALWHDVELIDSGDIMFPEQWTMDEDSEREESKGKSKVQRKRGIAWTKEEHERFLGGLEIYGKGDWKNIARYVVLTKSPTQVASHAQKYFNRKDRTENQKLRRSINDTHSIGDVRAAASPSLSSPSTRYTDRK